MKSSKNTTFVSQPTSGMVMLQRLQSIRYTIPLYGYAVIHLTSLLLTLRLPPLVFYCCNEKFMYIFYFKCVYVCYKFLEENCWVKVSVNLQVFFVFNLYFDSCFQIILYMVQTSLHSHQQYIDFFFFVFASLTGEKNF